MENEEEKNISNLSVRNYLDKTVVPIVLEGLIEISNRRFFN